MPCDPQTTIKRAPLTAIQNKVKANISEEAQAVVDELRKLLKEAEKGRITGLAYVINHSDESGYDMGVVGWYQSYPTDALGQLSVLRLKIERMALDGC